MAINCDDNSGTTFDIAHGGNGDYYPEISWRDASGKVHKSPSPRIATSGSALPPEIVVAVANLYRAIQAWGVSK